MTNTLIEKIDACLPQTQCTLCGYPDCESYATAIANKTETNLGLCQPGKVEALIKIGKIMQTDISPWVDKTNNDPPVVAKIIADQCIGCMKCINACPLDAIIGSGKKLHAIIEKECTGCKLCIDPCPVDCIIVQPSEKNSTKNLYKLSNKRRLRYKNKKTRLLQHKQAEQTQHIKAKQQRKQLLKEALNRVNNAK